MFSLSSNPEIKFRGEVPQWSPPREGWRKLNVAVSFSYAYSKTQAAGGGILRDENGKWCWAFSCDLGHDITATAAHLLVIKRGLDLALERRIPMIVLETSSSTALEMITSGEIMEEGHPLGKLVQECRILARQPWRIEFVHVRRAVNECAQILAEFGHSHFYSGFIEHDAPPTPKVALIVENESVKETK